MQRKTLTLILQDLSRRMEIPDSHEISLPGSDGRVGILPDHAFMYFGLTQGTVTVQPHNQTFEITGGVAEIKDNVCFVLTKGINSL